MNSRKYEVTVSTDGKHTVRVTFEDPDEGDGAISWALGTYAKMKKASQVQPVPVSAEKAPLCGDHGVPMERMNGRKGPFWSCHEKNADGSWCSYRPI